MRRPKKRCCTEGGVLEPVRKKQTFAPVLRSSAMPSRSIVFSLIFAATCIEGIATAQSSNGYVIGGVGSYSSKLISQAAIGGEMVFGKGIGAGGELGFIAGHSSFGFLSLNGYYHFAHHGVTRKLDPFVTGGYTLAFDPLVVLGPRNASNGVNIGFGLNYWFLRHLGVRTEFRDIVIPGNLPGVNSWGIRGGIAFR